MANYNLNNLSILFVEDSRFSRLLTRSLLFTVGVRKIQLANDGAQAIEMLKRMGETDDADGGGGVDMVISDLVMPGVDGLELLNWIRRDPKSPNAFLPFSLLTARADADVITQSRNLGANEFIAKPFSAASIARRLSAVINTPRQYVLTKGYFGPDRRRREIESVEPDRRVVKQEDTEIFRSPRNPTTLDLKEGRVCFFRLKNGLKEKLSGGAGAGRISAEHLALAEQEIARFGEDFELRAGELLIKLERTLDRIVDSDENLADHVRILNEGAHELRGQGGMFGLPLMTAFAKSLYECTSTVQLTTPMLLTLYKGHIDGMKVVLREEIEGAVGQAGAALLESLEKAKALHYSKGT
ncbi:MAG: response regulator [Rhodospirillaceae bacterium]|jgi:CheY-like chemotaxis protein|nr:response regulator [Rhodospirillaceae bacterium]MBT5664197.1 response regulator [Rhodospirillaceae bacterium]MBT5812301.1 response regulator [Rhodospirillaceae bacterium]